MSNGYGKNTSGFGITREQSIDPIVQACLDNDVTDTRQIDYVLATAQRAAEPEIATRILVLGMREGSFTPPHTLDRYINDHQTDYSGARAIVNSLDTTTADPIANLARHWEAEVPALVRRIQRDGINPLPVQAEPARQAPAMLLARGDASQDVFEMQQYLAALGMQDGRNKNIAVDGDFGPGTEQAVQRYERSRGVEPPTGRVDDALFAQLRADTLQVDPGFRRRTMTDLHGPLNDGNLALNDKGEPVFEIRLQLEKLGYIEDPQRDWNGDRIYNRVVSDAVRRFQEDQRIGVTGIANPDTRSRLNELATARGFAPTTEFDRAENWPPMPPPYTRVEYQLERAQRTQAALAVPQPVRDPARRGDDAARDAGPAAMDRAAPGAGQPAARARENPDPSHPGHPRHALYQGCAAGVDALDRQLGRAPDERSDCMKASLAELAVRSGFDRVDHVLLSIRSGDVQAGQNVFVVQGALGDPAHLRAHMRTDAAVAAEVEVSFRKIAALDQTQAGPAAEQALHEQAQQEQDTQARSVAARLA